MSHASWEGLTHPYVYQCSFLSSLFLARTMPVVLALFHLNCFYCCVNITEFGTFLLAIVSSLRNLNMRRVHVIFNPDELIHCRMHKPKIEAIFMLLIMLPTNSIVVFKKVENYIKAFIHYCHLDVCRVPHASQRKAWCSVQSNVDLLAHGFVKTRSRCLPCLQPKGKSLDISRGDLH